MCYRKGRMRRRDPKWRRWWLVRATIRRGIFLQWRFFTSVSIFTAGQLDAPGGQMQWRSRRRRTTKQNLSILTINGKQSDKSVSVILSLAVVCLKFEYLCMKWTILDITSLFGKRKIWWAPLYCGLFCPKIIFLLLLLNMKRSEQKVSSPWFIPWCNAQNRYIGAPSSSWLCID